jgi:hypothetical protein
MSDTTSVIVPFVGQSLNVLPNLGAALPIFLGLEEFKLCEHIVELLGAQKEKIVPFFV